MTSETIKTILKNLNACEFTYANARARGWTIPNAIKRAKLRKEAWDKKDFQTYKLAPGQTHFNPRTNGKCWIENVSIDCRVTGYADELAQSIRHKGWFCNQYEDETFRGQVIQFPARNGMPQYYAGYADSWNDDCGFFDLSESFDDPKDAALRADSIAEAYAEEEREYQIKESARIRIEENESAISETRKTILALCKELKQARKISENSGFSEICKRIRADISGLLESIAELREENENLTDRPWLIAE